jgi:hypothetical protein
MSELLLKAIRTISGISKLRLEADPPVTEVKMESRLAVSKGVGATGILASFLASVSSAAD